MPLPLKTLGRLYTTLSLAVLPVAITVVVVFLATFKEHGSQSQGLPALVAILAVIIGVLGVNTLAATLLAVLVPGTRPVKKQYLLTLLAIAATAVLIYTGMFLSA